MKKLLNLFKTLWIVPTPDGGFKFGLNIKIGKNYEKSIKNNTNIKKEMTDECLSPYFKRAVKNMSEE